jgi:hypothetical protein
MADELEFTVNLDGAWWPLGDGTDAPTDIADALMTTLIPGLEGPSAIALNANLVMFAEWAQMLAPGERRSFALVRTPELGSVDALLSWRYSETIDGLYERYLEIARDQHSTQTVELVNQRVLEYEIPTGRAIVIHDSLIIRDGGLIQPARERCTTALFLNSGPYLVEQHLATMDLALFDDIVEYSLGLLSGENPGVPGLLQYRGEV